MTEWLDIFHWSVPDDRPILARLSDGREVMVEFNPLRQAWIDDEGKGVVPVSWRKDDG